MKFKIVLSLMTMAFASSSLAGALSGIVLSSSGQTVLMSQKNAKRYCESNGMRLPTAREFAEHYQKMGLKIREAQVACPTLVEQAMAEIQKNKKDGFGPVVISADEQSTKKDCVAFYENHKKFKNTENLDYSAEMYYRSFWTSEMGPSQFGHSTEVVLYEPKGVNAIFFRQNFRSNPNSVRCALN